MDKRNLLRLTLGVALVFMGWSVFALIWTRLFLSHSLGFGFAILVIWTCCKALGWLEVKPILENEVFPKSEVIKIPEVVKSHEEIILAVIRDKGKAKRGDLLPEVKFSKATLVRLLDKMEEQGLIRQVGERKATYYELVAQSDTPVV